MKKIFLLTLIISMIVNLSLSQTSLSRFSQNKVSQNQTIEILLETVGILSFQGVLITSTAIKSFTNGYIDKINDEELTLEMLSLYIELTTAVNEQLNDILKSGILDSEDTGLVIELNNIYELLLSSGDAFSKYIRTKNEPYLHIYDDNMSKAWDKIEQLMEL